MPFSPIDNSQFPVTSPPSTPAPLDQYIVTAAGTTTTRTLSARFGDVIYAKDAGIKGDGATDDTIALKTAAATALSVGTTLVITCKARIAGAVGTISCPVRFEGGGSLDLQTGGSVTLSGELVAGLHQIFYANGGTLTLTARVHCVYPQWWGALVNGVHDDSAAIQAAITAATGNGVNSPGHVYLSAGTWNVTTNNIIFSTAGVSLLISGAGPILTNLATSSTSGNVMEVNYSNTNTDNIAIRDIGLSGSVSTGLVGLKLTGWIQHGNISNLAFNAFDTALQLGDVFLTKFVNLRFHNYNTAITGTAGHFAQNNTFDTCHFSFGATNTSLGVKSVGMGYNTWLTPDFEAGGLMGSADFSGGTGWDTVIGARFERLNAGTASWLITGDNQRFINPTLQITGVQNAVGSAFYLLDMNGKNTRVEGLLVSNSTYFPNSIRLNTSSIHNFVSIQAPPSSDNYNTPDGIYSMVVDLGTENEIVYPSGARQFNGTITEGGGRAINLYTDSLGWGSTTFDGLTNHGQQGGAGIAALGPHGDGYSILVNDSGGTGGNRNAYFTYAGGTNGLTYIFSFYVLPVVAGDTIDVAFDTAHDNTAHFKTITLNSTTKWQRIWYATRATSTTTYYASIRPSATTLLNASHGLYISAPMIGEYNNNLERLGPTADIRTTSVTGFRQVTNPRPIGEGGIWERAAATAVPTVGSYRAGEIVRVIDAAVGAPPLYLCTTGGSPGTWTPMGTSGVTNTLSGTKSSFAIGTVGAAGNVTTTLTVTGATTAGAVFVSPTTTLPAPLSVYGYVSSSNTVTLVIGNGSAAGVAGGTATFNVWVVQ